MEENADLMMVIAVVHLVGLAPNAPKVHEEKIIYIIQKKKLTKRNISSFHIYKFSLPGRVLW